MTEPSANPVAAPRRQGRPPRRRRGLGIMRTWTVEKAPVGTVRIRTRCSGNQGRPRVARVRVIKVAAGGGRPERWVNFARWWWERNRGPVPTGKCVLHLNGDLMDDSPSNLALGTAADRIALWHINNPQASVRQLERAHRGCAEHNRVRGTIRRLTAWLHGRWYPVDLERRIVLLAPSRKKWQVYAGAGVQARDRTVGSQLAAALGFPLRTAGEASVLAALLDLGSWHRVAEVLARTGEIRALRGWRPLTVGWIRSCVVRLRREGLVESRRAGVPVLYRATAAARAGRLPPCPYVPRLGRELAGEAFVSFTRCHPDGRPVERDRPTPESLSALIKEATCPSPPPPNPAR